MSAGTVAESNPIRTPILRNPFRLLFSAEPWMAFIFMLLSFILGVFWFVVLVTLISTGTSLVISLIGLPILALTLLLWIQAARSERWRVRAFLGVEIPDPYDPLPEDGWWPRFKARLLDRHVWLDLLYLFLLFPIGIAEFVIATVAISVPFTLVTVPLWYRATDVQVIAFDIDTLPEAIAIAIAGVPVLLLVPYIFVGVGRGHAWFARRALGRDREAELSARVDQLTDSRSRALESAVADLRRIERDLHDGAQQRLVKLSMDLGRAKAKLENDPEGALALIEEAHEESKLAMREIRDLARGIHPAVLTDRGLDGAVSALAARSTVPVTVDVNLAERLPDAIESTAYFVIAETLTNVARHSEATRAGVRVYKQGERLIIEIADDGTGGADETRGTGLSGMRDRIAGVDGTLSIESPPGGPTVIRVELPCGL